MKKIIIWLVVIIIVGFIIYSITKGPANKVEVTETPATTASSTIATSTENTATTTPAQNNGPENVIGKSVEGRDITAYHFGNGSTELLFAGGIHGGYEWNTVLVASQSMDYLKTNPGAVPANIKVTVIPVLNPDGLSKVVGTTTGNFTAKDITASTEAQTAGRFNANKVDLNRNFDCDWQAFGKWQSKTVSGGTASFSEPESQAIKNYIETNKPAAVIAWYSAAGGVYASSCDDGAPVETATLAKTYATASGYPYHESFDAYATTGDMMNWLAKNNIPAISVLLTNHTDTEWSKNQKGIEAVLKFYTQ